MNTSPNQSQRPSNRSAPRRPIAALCWCALFAAVLSPVAAQEELPAPLPRAIAPAQPIEPAIAPAPVWGEFPRPEPPLLSQLIEQVPASLSWPVEPLGRLFEKSLQTEHDHLESALGEYPIGLQELPPRPPLVLELNERFLGRGFLHQGWQTPSGAIWRPSLWLFGQFRSAWQYFDRDRRADPVVEWANRLDLFAQLNLSGTERVLVGLRPYDEEQGGRRTFSGYDLRNGQGINGLNTELQTLFFEGDFGELFPGLDPADSHWLDLGFSVGRMPLLAQQGLLINEDMLDAVTVTRNTLTGHGLLNLRATGVYSWRGINRNSPTGRANDFDPASHLLAILTESDFAKSTVNLDAVYVRGDDSFGDLWAVGVSAIQRHHGYRNTYNTSLHLLSSFPDGPRTDYANQGELLFAQMSWTPHHTEDLVYLNSFWAIDQFTAPARGPELGGPLDQTGVLFAGVGLGRSRAPVAVRTDDTAGASLGYQLFFDHTREQILFEVGGFKQTGGPARGALGTALRYQKAMGQHVILVLDGFVAQPEGRPTAHGARTELLVKF